MQNIYTPITLPLLSNLFLLALHFLPLLSLQAQVTDSIRPKRIQIARGETIPNGLPSVTPFGGRNFTWMNGQSRQQEYPLASLAKGIVAMSLNVDTYFNYNFANPVDNTQTISSTVGRHNEFTVNLASLGFEAYYKGSITRLLLQTGNMASLIQDLDGTVQRGANLSVANGKLIREAVAGYHWDKWNGINFEMGIFMSYIGLESYMTYENWNYNRSMVCDFTPFYFSGARLQLFPSRTLKLEPWLMNGFQTYGKYNYAPAAGMSINYRPTQAVAFVANFYDGADYYINPLIYGSQPGVRRFHHDHSILIRYVDNPGSKGISRMAFSLNNHYGQQNGSLKEVKDAAGNILVHSAPVNGSLNYILGTSLVNRIWFAQNKFAWTLRGEYVTNPGNHLTLGSIPGAGLPNGQQVNGYAVENNSKFLTADKVLKAWGITTGFDYMPNDFITFRLEYLHRGANYAWFTGHNGTTPNYLNTNTATNTYTPDLQTFENRVTFAINARL